MQAVVKTPHTEIIIKGILPDSILRLIKKEYGNSFHIIDDETDTGVDIFKTQWYRSVKDSMTPGDYLRSHRERMQWTQSQLGNRLGNIPRQHISNMETGKRPISLRMAKALAEVFNTDFSIFIQ
jgi:DNA-binding XRE family transcriptional regulator